MWVWVDSGSYWWTGRPGVLWFTGLQRIRHNWATELNQTELGIIKVLWGLVPAYLFTSLPAIVPRASHTTDLEHCFLFSLDSFITQCAFHSECLTLLCRFIPILASGSGGLVTKSCRTLATLWTVACQAPLSMSFSRQEYWSGLPFPSPWDLPNPGIEPRSPALQADDLPTAMVNMVNMVNDLPTAWEAPMLQRFPLISPPLLKVFPDYSTVPLLCFGLF